MTESLKHSLRTSYDKKAAYRDRLESAPWKVAERQSFLDRLHSENRRSLLELGSGPGRDGQFFQEQGMTVTCTDLSPEMVALCRQKGLTAHVMDMADLQFETGSFGAVYAMNSLLHQPKRELPSVLRGIQRVLAPEGLFYMGVWGGWDFEGILAEDSYRPKRFFSFYADGPAGGRVQGFRDHRLQKYPDTPSGQGIPVPVDDLEEPGYRAKDRDRQRSWWLNSV